MLDADVDGALDDDVDGALDDEVDGALDDEVDAAASAFAAPPSAVPLVADAESDLRESLR